MPEIPFVFHWSFSENKLLALKDSIDGNLLSDDIFFDIPGFKYYLSIYPNGDINERRGQTWIFLYSDFKNKKKVEADYTFVIESANYSKTFHCTYDKSIGWGSIVCKTKEFFKPDKKYIVDGKCTLKVYGVFKFENQTGQQKWEGGELGNKLWMKEDTKDFTIITKDDKEIKVHKFILASTSDVFAAMFNSNMKEATENKMEATDFFSNVVETGIKLIYTCNITTSLSLEELILLLQFFDKYQLSTFKEKVEPYLIDQISTTTVCNLTNASILTNSFKLKDKCMEFLSAAFTAKTPLDNFDILDKDIVFEIVQNSVSQIVKTGK